MGSAIYIELICRKFWKQFTSKELDGLRMGLLVTTIVNEISRRTWANDE